MPNGPSPPPNTPEWGTYGELVLQNTTLGSLGNFSPNPFKKTTIRKDEDEMTIPMDAKAGFTFGCDPELFVFNAEGKPVPADMIPGTKLQPHKVPFGAVQRDGFAAEFNIDPVTNFEDFNKHIEEVMKSLKQFLPKGWTLKADASVTFDKDIFDSAPDAMKELGCLPDLNAWTGEVTPSPKLDDNPYMRCAGGHLHVGFPGGPYSLGDTQHVLNCRDLAKQFDWFLGGWSLKLDEDATRRKLYGKAGACRIKPYGVEYRVLSNFWITSKERRLAVWNRMQEAINRMATLYLPDRAASDNDLLIQAINTSVKRTTLYRAYNYPLQTLVRRH